MPSCIKEGKQLELVLAFNFTILFDFKSVNVFYHFAQNQTCYLPHPFFYLLQFSGIVPFCFVLLDQSMDQFSHVFKTKLWCSFFIWKSSLMIVFIVCFLSYLSHSKLPICKIWMCVWLWQFLGAPVDNIVMYTVAIN